MPRLLGTIVALIEPTTATADGFAANINVIGGPGIEGRTDYVKTQVRLLTETMNEFRLIDVIEEERPPAKRTRILGRYSDGGRDLTLDQLHVLTASRSVVVSAIAPSQRFEQLRPVLDRVLASVEISERLAEGKQSTAD